MEINLINPNGEFKDGVFVGETAAELANMFQFKFTGKTGTPFPGDLNVGDTLVYWAEDLGTTATSCNFIGIVYRSKSGYKGAMRQINRSTGVIAANAPSTNSAAMPNMTANNNGVKYNAMIVRGLAI